MKEPIKRKVIRFMAYHRIPILDRFGITFTSKNAGEVLWIWPWKRKEYKCVDRPFHSIVFGVNYPSLKAIEAEWAGYERAEWEASVKDIVRQVLNEYIDSGRLAER